MYKNIKKILFLPLIFFLSYFTACAIGNNSNSNSNNNIIVSYSYPSTIYVGQNFQISLEINSRLLNNTWTVCLMSFKSLAYNVTGSMCSNAYDSKYNNGLSLVKLPYGGYITLSNPNLLTSNIQNIDILLCYPYNEYLSLSGCLNQNSECNFNVENVNSEYPIQISQAYSLYKNGEYYLYLELYYVGNNNNDELYYITNQNTVENCNLNNIDISKYTFNYILKYQLQSQSISIYQGNGTINPYTQQGFLVIPINYNGNLPDVTLFLDFKFYVMQEYNLGSIIINSNT